MFYQRIKCGRIKGWYTVIEAPKLQPTWETKKLLQAVPERSREKNYI